MVAGLKYFIRIDLSLLNPNTVSIFIRQDFSQVISGVTDAFPV